MLACYAAVPMPVEFSIHELIRSRAFRRAVSFVIGIGIPAAVCLWLRLSDGLLLAVITALMFSFADDEGPLINRFIALGRSAAGIALGAAGGYLLGGYSPLFWLLFIVAAFAAAWLNRAGRTAHIGARLAVMAMAITAGTPGLSRVEVFCVVGSLAVVTLARLADHAVFGPLPASTLRTPPPVPENDWLWVRYAAAYAVAAAAGLWLGLMVDPAHAIWVAITTLVVMQPDDRSNYRRILERVVGTIIGTAVAFVLTRLVLPPAVTVAAIIATAAVLPHHIPLRYWAHTAAIALLVLMSYDLASEMGGTFATPSVGLFTERLVDVFVGAALALAGTFVAFPWNVLRAREPEEQG